MANRKYSCFNLIQFVSENTNAESQKGTRRTIANNTYTSELDKKGEDVKKFYEALINESKTSSGDGLCKSQSIIDNESKQLNMRRKAHRRKGKESQYNSEGCVAGIDGCHNMKSITLAQDKIDISEAIPARASANPSTLSAPTLCHSQRQESRLLRAAQMGDLKQVSELVMKGIHINNKDFYGWTPLMCAAKEGHEEVVRYLLTHGADQTMCNSDGQNASTLALMSGFHFIVKVISDFSLHGNTYDDAERETAIPGHFYCEICRSEISHSEKSHETSTIHLFNSGHKPKGPSYLIPETNKGYQILLKTGWEIDKGLGLRGDGCKYPIKTVLKYDRKGLGDGPSVKKTAKVTHFNPHDKSAILCHSKSLKRKMTVRKAAQYASKAKERKDRERERCLRFELSGGYE